MLWKVQAASAPPSWLLATVDTPSGHTADFKPEVEAALLASTHIGTEYFEDMNAGVELAKKMLTEQASLASVLGEPLFAQLLPLLAARGYP